MQKEKLKNRSNPANIYVLSVGINQYRSEDISNLSGCVKDVYKLQELLKTHYDIPDYRYKVCVDHQATRDGIIHSFLSHFKQMKTNDIALFHYSGHGSWEPTHQVFVDCGYEPQGGRNEVIVCSDSQIGGIPNIADKELRWMIAEIQNHCSNEEAKPAFYGIFDCCHSGSILRDEIRIRMTPALQERRTLKTYADGQFHAEFERKGKVELPYLNYISMTACSPFELAREGADGGYFTNAIIEILSQRHKEGNSISFSELHTLCRLLVQQKSRYLQNPYFEYCGDVDPNSSFLLGKQCDFDFLPFLILDNEEWIVNLGAIHGISYSSWKENKLKVFEKQDRTRPIGTAKVIGVQVERTILEIDWEPLFSYNDSKQLCLSLIPPAISFALNKGENGNIGWELLKKVLHKQQFFKQLVWNANANYELEVTDNQFLLYKRTKNERALIIGIDEYSEQAALALFRCLQQVIKWEYIRGIKTPKESEIFPKHIDFKFVYRDQNGKEKVVHVDNRSMEAEIVIELQIPYQIGAGYIFYKVEVQNNFPGSKGLYFYLIHLGEKYEVIQKYEHYSKMIYFRESALVYNSKVANKALGITDESVKEVEENYLLIVSQEKLVYPYFLHQEGFGSNFGKTVSAEALTDKYKEVALKSSIRANWLVKQLVVRLIKK